VTFDHLWGEASPRCWCAPSKLVRTEAEVMDVFGVSVQTDEVQYIVYIHYENGLEPRNRHSGPRRPHIVDE